MTTPARRLRAAMILPVAAASLLIDNASYVTPGGPADFRALGITPELQETLADPGIAALMDRRPAASFPASIAVARVQGRGYRSDTWRGSDVGVISLMGHFDEDLREHAERVAGLPMIRGIAPLNRLVAGEHLRTEEDLRKAAARAHADMLLLYTFDTQFESETTIPALGIVTLGIFPNDLARVWTIASAVLLDTRTGYVYALAEASDEQQQIANAWTNEDAIDQARRRAERKAFAKLIDELAAAWEGVVETYTLTQAP